MRKIIFVSLFLILAVALAACGNSPSMPMQEGAAAPEQAQGSGAKEVNIVVTSNPSPAMKGDVELFFAVTDKDGKPIEGAEVKVSAEHPSMAGMGMSGLATDQGGGKYSIKANFSDSGDWVLTVSVHKDGVDHEEKMDLKIQ